MEKGREMKAIEIINALNESENLLDADVMIKDCIGNYALIKSIDIDKNGDIFIAIDNKHYIKKIIEQKTEIPEAKRY